MDEDRLVLPDPMGAIDRLFLHSRVPPGIVENYGVGGGQVHAHAAGLQANEKHGILAALECVDFFRSVPRFARQQTVAKFRGFETRPDEIEHGGELRKYQDAPAFRRQLVQQVFEPLELGGLQLCIRLARQLQQPGIATRLAHIQERVEHNDARAVQALGRYGRAHLGVHGEADRFVEVALLALHFDALDDLGLGRQFARDLIFRAAQQKRLDAAREMARALGVAALLDRRAERLREPGAVAEEARRHDIEQRPQFAEMIF